MLGRARLTIAIVFGSVICVSTFLAQAQNSERHYEIGTVYYVNGDHFQALDKETATQGGRASYSARVKGAHASIRLRADQPKIFRICGVDPSRFKLYRFKSDGKERTLTIAKNNLWIGGSKTVLSASEIPVAIQTAENACFTLTPQATLGDGEFGFSPAGDLDAFMFGVGDIDRSK